MDTYDCVKVQKNPTDCLANIVIQLWYEGKLSLPEFKRIMDNFKANRKKDS